VLVHVGWQEFHPAQSPRRLLLLDFVLRVYTPGCDAHAYCVSTLHRTSHPPLPLPLPPPRPDARRHDNVCSDSRLEWRRG